MDKAQIIERMAFIADDEPPEVAQPGKETLNLPATAVAAQGAAILGLGAFAVASVGRNHLDPKPGQRYVEAIRVIGAVADEPYGHVRYEAGIERGGDKRDLVRRS